MDIAVPPLRINLPNFKDEDHDIFARSVSIDTSRATNAQMKNAASELPRQAEYVAQKVAQQSLFQARPMFCLAKGEYYAGPLFEDLLSSESEDVLEELLPSLAATKCGGSLCGSLAQPMLTKDSSLPSARFGNQLGTFFTDFLKVRICPK